jgi:hypothetical protein
LAECFRLEFGAERESDDAVGELAGEQQSDSEQRNKLFEPYESDRQFVLPVEAVGKWESNE